VALLSVFAAIFLTGSKFIIGVMTGSLGILSEAPAFRTGSDCRLITYFSVRISDKPADRDHHYGHGKSKYLCFTGNLFIMITCSWIIYEAIQRLLTVGSILK